MQTGQLGQLLNMGTGASEWQRQGLMGLSNTYQGVGGMDINSRQTSAMNATGLDYVMSLLGGAAGE